MDQQTILFIRNFFPSAALALALAAAAIPAAGQSSVNSDDGRAPAIVHNTWSSGKAMPVATQDAMAALLMGKIFVVGGHNAQMYLTNVQIYDPATDTWAPNAAPMPVGVVGAAISVVRNKLYVIGGGNASGAQTVVQVYDPKKNAWTQGPNPMPVAADDVGSAVEDNLIYVVGGNGNGQLRLATVQAYDPATQTWSNPPPAPLSNGKSEPSVARIGATIVTADGFTASAWTGDNEGYSASTDSWSPLKTDPEPRNEACTGASSTVLYVAGGTGNPNALLSSTESFRLSKDSWKSLANIPNPTTSAAGIFYKGRLYCFGGGTSSTGGGSIYNFTQIYQP